MAIFLKGGGGGGGVALDGDYADPDQLGSGKSGTAPGQAKQRLAADQTWSEPLEHFAESWDETYKVSALTGREDPADAEANVGIVLVPKGTGSLISGPVPDGTSSGGNTRGAYSVDWQAGNIRSAATQVASGQGSTIGGGARQTAGGSYATIAGGFQNIASNNDAAALGGRTNTASGTQSTVCGGQSNTATADAATVVGGENNDATNTGAFIGGGTGGTASGSKSTVGGGNLNTASGTNSTVGGGQSNTASAQASSVLGGEYATANLWGQQAFASGRFSAAGDAQQSFLTMRNSTTDATQTELFLDGTDDRITVPSGSRFRFRVDIICTNETDGTGNAYEIKGAIKNIAGTTSLIGTNVSNEWEDDAAFAAVVEADDTNDALVVKVTGAASKTCRWVASVHLVQVT